MKRKKILITAMALVLTLGACGGSPSYDSSYKPEDAGAYDSSYDYDEPASYENEMADSEESTASTGLSDIPEGNDGITAKKISQEKLIYTCNISIDTLDFEKSTKDLAQLVQKYDGFLESETYSDGGSYDSYSYYYVENTEKHNSYEATIRIPSNKYNEFLDNAGNLGDIRSRNSNVENVSQEYTDLTTSLEVYEAAYKRYLDLLEKATDESYALELESKITETQEKIAQIKTRMNKIDTDVSYSFINIRIKEVSKYEPKPAPTDTFGQRVAKAFSESMEVFRDFLEGVLIVLIHLLPFIVLIGIIVAIVIAIRIKIKASPKHQAKVAARNAKRRNTPGFTPVQNQQTPQPKTTTTNPTPNVQPEQKNEIQNKQ